MSERSFLPILGHAPGEPSVFLPGNLIESARRQKSLAPCKAPAACLLDFDGELVEHVVAMGRAQPDPSWPCFHTRLYRCNSDHWDFGIVGGTVGAPFAVLVAEELFACGCQVLVSIGSAGLLAADLRPPLFLLIERALRDEGTSYHYLPPAPFVEADPSTLGRAQAGLARAGMVVRRGTTWTTDAPFRETAGRIADCRRQGIMAVEMEAAALLAFAAARRRTVVCLSHVTNQMATQEDDFDKGGRAGCELALRVCEEILRTLLGTNSGKGAANGINEA